MIISLSALFILIGVIVYAASLPTDFFASYSMGLVIIASFLFICAGCMLIPDIKNKVYRRRPKVVRTPSTPSLVSVESPPPRYASRAETPVYYTPRRPRGVWVYKEYDDPSPRTVNVRSITPPPREVVRSYSPPRERVRVHHIRALPPPQASYVSPRRYGTPRSVQRYDYKARWWGSVERIFTTSNIYSIFIICYLLYMFTFTTLGIIHGVVPWSLWCYKH